ADHAAGLGRPRRVIAHEIEPRLAVVASWVDTRLTSVALDPQVITFDARGRDEHPEVGAVGSGVDAQVITLEARGMSGCSAEEAVVAVGVGAQVITLETRGERADD